MVSIVTAFWGDKYSVDDLKKLPIDYCFSDREIPGVKTLPLDMSYKHTWKKMTLFDKRLKLGDCLFLDIDLIIQGDIQKRIKVHIFLVMLIVVFLHLIIVSVIIYTMI